MKKELNVRELEKVRRRIKAFLDKEDAVREYALKQCRTVTRLASSAIKNIHQGDRESAQDSMEEASRILRNTKSRLQKFPEIYFAGFLHSAEKELVEAWTVFCVISNKKLPEPEAYGFDPICYLHGLAESVGELRRHLLDNMRQGKLKDAETFLKIMDDIYFFLMSFNYPDALTRSLRRQTDYVRSMLEGTRADVTRAILR